MSAEGADEKGEWPPEPSYFVAMDSFIDAVLFFGTSGSAFSRVAAKHAEQEIVSRSCGELSGTSTIGG